MTKPKPKRDMIARLSVTAVAVLISPAINPQISPKTTAAFSPNKVNHRQSSIVTRSALTSISSSPRPYYRRARVGNAVIPSSNTALYASPSSIISPSDDWGNVAVLSLAASLAQLLGRTTSAGKLLGAPVTAMALSFVLSSVGWVPILSSPSSSSLSTWKWNTVLPPGGSKAGTLLQGVSLTLATPLLLLGASLRGEALRQCGSLLGSFIVASLGTLAGATLAFSLGIQQALTTSLPNGDGVKIASALLAKNIGGGINYMAVCSCLSASPESIAAGLCVDNVMALVYFPFVSFLASKYEDLSDGGDHEESEGKDDLDAVAGVGNESSVPSPIEALSHAFTLAAVLTASGQFCNSKLHHLLTLLGRSTGPAGARPINLSLPITTLLTVLFSTYYPPNIFLSPMASLENNGGKSNDITRAGETLGTVLLYLFFATAGAPGWRLKDSIQRSFPPIASFLVILYGIHGVVLWGTKKLVGARTKESADLGEGNFWKNVVAPQRLLVASSAAIGGPATAAALAKSFGWESLLTPSLLVGNVGYAVATFAGLLFYGLFR